MKAQGISQLVKENKELKALISLSDCYMGVKALSKYSDLSERKLRELLNHPLHPLPSYKVDGSIRVKKSDFDTWLKRFRLMSEKNTDIDRLINDVMKDFQKV